MNAVCPAQLLVAPPLLSSPAVLFHLCELSVPLLAVFDVLHQRVSVLPVGIAAFDPLVPLSQELQQSIELFED